MTFTMLRVILLLVSKPRTDFLNIVLVTAVLTYGTIFQQITERFLHVLKRLNISREIAGSMTLHLHSHKGRRHISHPLTL